MSRPKGGVGGSGGGLMSWLTTTDHKRIGLLYFYTAFAFFLIGGLDALVIRAQLAQPDGHLVSAETYNQLFTMHGTTMIFLALMPLSASFFNYIVPLQIGARDVAFPRLNAFSYWVFLFGGLLMNASWVAGPLFHAGQLNVAPDAGWFGYANLTSRQYSPGPNIDFWMFGLQILGVSSLAAGFNFIVTILNMRAPGMRMMRLPVFCWMTLVTSFLIITAFPVVTVALVLLMFDRFFGTHFYLTSAGGDPVLWQHLFWLFGHPEVYILILPAMGIVSEVLPTFARKPLFGYTVVVYSGVLIGFMGWGVWSHHMFAVGLGPIADSVFAATTMLIAVPTGVKIFNWLATLWGGQLRFTSAMLFALGFIALFTIGGLSGITHAAPPADLQQTDTYYVVAHLHYVLFGGTVFGLFAGMYYWWPKMTGRLLSEPLGRWHFALMFVGMNLAFFPMHLIGLLGMPRRIYTYSPELGVATLNLVSSVGAFLIGVSVLVFIWNVWRTRTRGQLAGNDPWGGATLEWTIASPPPVHNFDVIPTVASRLPRWTKTQVKAIPEGAELAEFPVPSGSIWPLVTALGLPILALAPLSHTLPLVFVGAAIVLLGIYRWAFEPPPLEG
ncbi:MAG TPA: cytochrome c oxidase subunit I [Gemmatimonadales bacterium]|nr:cytochrome c oxidase subunit I [Gemmatimonadales bacterium]